MPDFSQARWVTAQELLGCQPGQPLTVNMSHDDVIQSYLGNCWLLAAISALAESREGVDHNEDIQNLFVTKEYYPGHPVQIQLYHVADVKDPFARDSSLQPVVYNVADKFLVRDDGKGYTAAVKHPEDVWVLFLEAAFAMMAGKKSEVDEECYQRIDGGFAQVGIMGLIGTKNVDEFRVDPSTGAFSVHNLQTGQLAQVDKDQMWHMLLGAEQGAELLVCAINDANGDGVRNNFRGMVEGHAYSIKEVFEREDGVRVVRVRNPWGTHDQGTEDQLREVALECYTDGQCDYDWDTFIQYHHSVSVVNRHRPGSCMDYLGDTQFAEPGTVVPQPCQAYKSDADGGQWGEDDTAQEADQGAEEWEGEGEGEEMCEEGGGECCEEGEGVCGEEGEDCCYAEGEEGCAYEGDGGEYEGACEEEQCGEGCSYGEGGACAEEVYAY